MKDKRCVICNDVLEGRGNNADPLANGQCCDSCNGMVIKARLEKIWGVRNES